MITVSELKDRLMTHLNGVDFSKMSVGEISTYVDILKKVSEMETPTPFEAIAKLAGGFTNPPPMPVKEIEMATIKRTGRT